MTDKVTALVPIKAHSERVPRKNFRDFNGRPLYHWILATLEATEVIDKIVINTDSREIMEEAADIFNVEIIERPQHLRGDEVPMNDIILYDVGQVKSDIYLQTHCTNPLLEPATITEAVERFREADEHDSLFSVTPLQTRLWNEEVEPINHSRDELLPTQELPPVYEENSNIYLFTQESVERRQNRIGDNPMIFEMEAEEAVDIDEFIDFKVAEFLHMDTYGEEPVLREVQNK